MLSSQNIHSEETGFSAPLIVPFCDTSSKPACKEAQARLQRSLAYAEHRAYPTGQQAPTSQPEAKFGTEIGTFRGVFPFYLYVVKGGREQAGEFLRPRRQDELDPRGCGFHGERRGGDKQALNWSRLPPTSPLAIRLCALPQGHGEGRDSTKTRFPVYRTHLRGVNAMKSKLLQKKSITLTSQMRCSGQQENTEDSTEALQATPNRTTRSTWLLRSGSGPVSRRSSQPAAWTFEPIRGSPESPASPAAVRVIPELRSPPHGTGRDRDRVSGLPGHRLLGR